MQVTHMVLTMTDIVPAGAEVFVALAACVLLLVDALGGGRAKGFVFLLAIA